MKVCVIIPAMNEAPAIAGVIESMPTFVDQIIVVDNASTDGTGNIARQAGADVIREETPGYGRSCLAGIRAAHTADILVFMDGDGADDPTDMAALIKPIREGDTNFVLGSRLSGTTDNGALTIPQRFGNSLACFLMKKIWHGRFTDLGPFRALRADKVERLALSAQTYGWTVEMQVRILKLGLKYKEIPVHYRRRIGVSKISGTARGVILAGSHILGVIAREALLTRNR